MKLSRAERRALHLILDWDRRHAGHGAPARRTQHQTDVVDGKPWINKQTALALERKGLVKAVWTETQGTLWLTPEGRRIAAQEAVDRRQRT